MGYLVPGEMDPEHGRIASSFSVLSGSDFDRQFMDQMVIDHRETISLFEARAATTPQNEIQEFAARTLPHLRHHLQKAEELQSQLRK
jgi:putative membrane protein